MIVDDSALVRETLKRILEQDKSIKVIATASDPIIALKKLDTNSPDVIILDIEMPRMDGLTFLKKIRTEFNIPVIGIPGTIDNDLWGTDATIGYDTALNTIMDCVDILRDTATSHERVFLVEVMGRDAGFLTLNAAIAAGAEAAIIPERATIIEQIEQAIGQGKRKSKNSSIVLVQEHAIEGGAQAVAKMMEEAHPEFSSRVTILGHLQRGGSPSASDRILASRYRYCGVGCASGAKH